MADIDTKLETGISLQEVAPEDDADLYRPDVDVSSVDERKLMQQLSRPLIDHHRRTPYNGRMSKHSPDDPAYIHSQCKQSFPGSQCASGRCSAMLYTSR